MDGMAIAALIGRALIALGNMLLGAASPAEVLRVVERIEAASQKVSADVDAIAGGR